MTYIRLVSDIHLDHDVDAFVPPREKQDLGLAQMRALWLPSSLPEDSDTVLVIAGDIWAKRRFLTRKYQSFGSAYRDSWLSLVARQFKYVVIVLGNHDYWGKNLSFEADAVRREIEAQNIPNAYLLEKNTLVLGDIKWVGATLWTDFDNHNTEVMLKTQFRNDYKYIRHSRAYHKISAPIIYKEHMASKSYVFEHAKKDHDNQKLIVVSHMAPSVESTDIKFRANIQNSLYYSSLEKNIIDNGQIDYWLHGHVHNSCDYHIGPTRVLCNPRGYPKEVGITFNEDLKLKV